MKLTWKTETRNVKDLKVWQENPRTIDESSFKDLKDSVEQDGDWGVLVIDTDGTVISGNQRLKVAEGKVDVKVPNRKLTEKERRRISLRANRQKGKDNFDILANWDKEDLLEGWFDEKDLDKLLNIEPNEKDDAIPEHVEPIAKLGDIWQLGRHRVMCGDSTSLEAVSGLMGGVLADLVVTDPPYNTGMEGKPDDEKARLSHMFNDKIENWEEFLHDIFANYFANTKGDCAYYCFIDWRRVNDIRGEMEKLMDVKNVIVWDKKVHGLGSDYKSTYELCVVGKKGKPEINNRFGLDYQDIWRLQREIGRNKDHATAKPIELLEKPIIHASKQDDIVLDLFLGSGSTLIACEKTNRICYGMEIDPKYVDVIIKRYEDFTGNKAIKVL